MCRWGYQALKDALAAGQARALIVVEARRLAEQVRRSIRIGGVGLAECRESTAGALRELATTWHREAQHTRSSETLALAEQLYTEYLETFPREKDVPRMTFYHAELLYALERWVAAARAYTRVVELDPSGKHARDAAYAAVLCWKNAINVRQEKSARGPRLRDLTTLQPIPEDERRLLAAFETYLRLVPDAPERVTILYRQARIYYEHNHYREAVEIFARIATAHADHELAVYAANLLLDCLNIQKKKDELRRWVTRFLADRRLTQHGEFKVLLDRLAASLRGP